MRYSVVIANWNGAAFIARALAALEASARAAGGEGEIVVVDDASGDGSPALVERRFPKVRLIRNETNRGYAATVNRGLDEARGEVAVLLNNDIVVRGDFVASILRHFDAADAGDLFAVSAKTLQWTTGEPSHICMNGRWKRGRIELEWTDPPEPARALFVQTGACALRRARALELAGLRELYHPGYWEDYDLSYRAAKRGWRSIYDASAVAYHLGKASLTARYGPDGVSALRRRNELLFYWANLDDPAFIASHAGWLAARVVADLGRGRLDSLKAFARALARLRKALAARRTPARVVTVRDAELLRPKGRRLICVDTHRGKGDKIGWKKGEKKRRGKKNVRGELSGSNGPEPDETDRFHDRPRPD